MDYKVTKNYTRDPKIVCMPGNDKLSHKETFTAERGNQCQQLAYCHGFFNTKGQPPKESYSVWFNSFLNINERFIPEGTVALDIGAYDGDTTLPIAFCTGKTGKVYAFECGEAFMSQLSPNVGLNPNLNIEAVPYALMPISGVHEFLYTGEDYNGGHPSTNSWVGSYKVPRLVRAISFNEYFNGKDIGRLSFVKVDVEGHDFHVLWSFKEVLKELRPVIHAEWFPRTDPYIYQVLQYLEYSLFCGFTLEPLTLGKSQWRQDIVLVPTEKIENFELQKT